ncbi:hypothetical protein COT97_02290 [Candidatus Falkowbacteria bacterium CG10_big_fil_rev_8_21_14_0_10_39_11]|uniref:DHHA1 domain-containing protein n=1 Tax=Candidatus Falkowbacteria bacterium CG10_big_fil_rev_8_21_14_0_10_39_11 TaxID=1974565 RepID=A0A2H0V5G0_9BACT|nr:MAG: hypothetical protein COT97_02290 [Candidatus Falkowbacteria bacterium CG10_big_fil_rev_8_21_14_0_10_39_11]
MQKGDKIYIYFHADLDGVVSAFLMKKLLLAEGYTAEYGEYLNYGRVVKEGWNEYPFKEPFVIIDFKYHPKAIGYVDHHETHKMDCDLSGLQYCIFEPKAKACTGLLEKLAESKGVKLGRVKRLITQSEIVDAADYPKFGLKPIDYILPKRGFLKVARAIEDDNTIIPRILHDLDEMRIADWFDFRLESLAQKKYVRKIMINLRGRVKKSFTDFKSSSKIVGDTVVYDFYGKEFFRYMPGVVYLKSKYWLGLVERDGNFAIKMGVNPWSKTRDAESNIDVGVIAKKYGGGGHKAVAAIPGLTNYDEAKRVLEEVKQKFVEKII